MASEVIVVEGNDEEEDGADDGDAESYFEECSEPCGRPVWEFESFFCGAFSGWFVHGEFYSTMMALGGVFSERGSTMMARFFMEPAGYLVSAFFM